MKILKFGGTSVKDASRIKDACQIVLQAAKEDEIVVVCSALGGVTDELIHISELAAQGSDTYLKSYDDLVQRHLDTAHELFVGEQLEIVREYLRKDLLKLSEVLRGVYLIQECTARSKDLIMSFGERLSNLLVSEYLRMSEEQTALLDTRLVIKTNSQFGNAKIKKEETFRNIQNHANSNTPLRVVTGFIASTDKGETTTLGRGGSDFTASIFGAALGASEIQIWTDVDGVLTADPRTVPHARTIKEMTYEEAMEMSHFGAKVIYPPTMKPALDHGIPILIKNTLNPEAPGTRIQASVSPHGWPATGISSIRKISFLRVHGSGMIGVTGTASRLFQALARESVNIIMITQGSSEHSICVAVEPADSDRAIAAIKQEFALQIMQGQIEDIACENDLSVIAVIGERMRQTPGVSGRLFGALGRERINVVAIAQGSSERNISVVVSEHQVDQAMRIIHNEFFWHDESLHVFVVGTGLIGNTLLRQVKNLQQRGEADIHVHGIANTRGMVLSQEPIDVTVRNQAEATDLERFVEFVIDQPFSRKVFVDCTAAEEPTRYYERLLDAGVSVVTPNKKAASERLDVYKRIRKAQNGKSSFGYETNVGAGLPVIGTIRSLIETGDTIKEIQGVFSGTLSYLFNAYDGRGSFAELVSDAKAKGYTEPDPRDDLSGMDVARKLLILAREVGLDLDLADIEVENLTPEPCRSIESVDAFLLRLSEFDHWFAAKAEQAQKEGKVLRYVGRICDGKASVSLRAVGPEEACYSLSGSDNLIAIKTQRYKDQPLIVRGPGAGAEVTAAGVLSDILRCK